MNAKLNLLIAGLLSVAAHLELNRVNAQTIEYAVIDLGTLGGDYSVAYDINNHGQVVGYAATKQGLSGYHAFLYTSGHMQDLGTLGGEKSRARGINDHGQVVGDAEIALTILNYYHPYHAFLYSNGSMQDLGAFGGDRYHSIAYDINNRGQIIGYSQIDSMPVLERAFLYSDGVMKELKILLSLPGAGYESRASDINDRGQITGNAQLTSWDPRTFLYFEGSMQDLGALSGTRSNGYGINTHGQVVGTSGILVNGYYYYHAFLYSNGSMKDLGTLGGNWSDAYGINDNGQVVGLSSIGPPTYNIHAFIYSNGSVRNLNDLIDPASKWTLTGAWAINNAGQIVGEGRNPAGKQHAFLLNPLPPGWRKVIAETTPPQPTYSDGPEKLAGKDSLVVVTHGWKPDITWLEEMTNSIVHYFQDRGVNNWKVHAHKWVEKAQRPLSLGLGPERTLQIAEDEGAQLGKYLASQRWSHIHFIAHSAGSALIQAATRAIKDQVNGSASTTVHLTFLDPFVGLLYGGRNKYGKIANWADNYFSRDTDTVLTDQILLNAYNVEVTWLDSRKKPITVSYSTPSGDVSQTCYQTVSSHEWSHEFYFKTITEETVIGAEGFGFPLSKEMGNWDNLAILFPIGNEKPRVLGSAELSCPTAETKLTVSAIAKPDFTTAEIIKSATGTVIIHGVDFFSLNTSSPVWLAVPTVITNRVNFVSFGAAFIDTNKAEGLLSVYWNTNAIGSIDERVSASGLREYGFSLPITGTGSVGILGFRLDAFSAVASSAFITNVVLGFNGLQEPFALTITDASVNGTPVLQLNGPAGFNYTVESSTNLVGWETMAVLVNTNGTVRFTVPSITNAATRFYRAVAH